MHPSAFQTGKLFFDSYKGFGFKRILDIGGRDVNGSLRPYAPPSAEFVSIDLEPGTGVDVVLKDPYRYPFEKGHFDCVVSTSCLEHDRMFWLTFLEALRVLTDAGMMYLSVPSQGAYHGYPYDNWRFYPDASLALVEWSERSGQPVQLIESFNHPDMPFNDYVMVFAKAKRSRSARFLHEQIPGAYNVRATGTKDILNPRLETPGIELATLFGTEIAKLREQLLAAPGAPKRSETAAR